VFPAIHTQDISYAMARYCLFVLKVPLNTNQPTNLHVSETLMAVMRYKWRAPWKNRICSTTMKLRKSVVKSVTQQKTCNYIELFSSSAQDCYARHI